MEKYSMFLWRVKNAVYIKIEIICYGNKAKDHEKLHIFDDFIHFIHFCHT